MESIEKLFFSKAIEEKLISNQSVKDIVKKASNLNKYASTGNFTIDYCNLIAGLKESGKYKEAQTLEHVFSLFKKAETHLYRVHDEDGKDLIDFAHSSNDNKVFPEIKNDLGKVEDIEEQHDKIVQVLNKKPTGKQAKLNEAIFAVAKVLNININKIAQDMEEELSDVSPDTLKKIQEANDLISKTLSSNLTNLDNASTATGISENNLADWLALTEDKILQGTGTDFFLKENKIDKKNFDNFKNAYVKLGQAGPISTESISKLIYGLRTFNSAYSYFSSLDPKIGDSYFGGSNIIGVDADDSDEWNKINSRSINEPEFKNRPGSVWDLKINSLGGSDLKLNPQRVAITSQIIFNWVTTWKASFINEKTIGNTNAAIVKALTPIKTSIDNLKSVLDPKQFLSQNKIKNTTGFAVGTLQSANQLTNQIEKNLNSSGTIYNSVGAVQSIQNIMDALNASKLNVDALITDLSAIKLGSSLDEPMDEQTQISIGSVFLEIAKIWNRYLKSGQASEEDSQVIENNRNQAYGVYSTIKDNVGKPYAMIYKNISNWFPKATSPNILYSVGQKGLEYAKSSVPSQFHSSPKSSITANNKNEIVKNADFGTLKGKPAPSAGGTKPIVSQKGNNSGSLVAGLGKLDPNDPSQVAVGQMQLALNNFGRMISIEENKSKFPKMNNYDSNDGLKIIGTGPKSNVQLNVFDGKWSTNTDNALKIASKYLSSLGLTLNVGAKWNQSTKSHVSGAIEAAKENVNILNRANAYLSGSSSLQKQLPDSTIFDTLPQEINWNLDVGPAQATFDGGKIKVTKGNFSSLQAFYEFLTSNGLKNSEISGESETDIGTEGFTPKTWNESLQWFLRRAVLKYQAMKDVSKEAAEQAKDYYGSANRLMNQYKKMISVFVQKGQIKSDEVIRPDLIASFSGKGGEISESTQTIGSKKRKPRVDSESSVTDESAAFLPQDAGKPKPGERIGTPQPRDANIMPFGDTINFRDEDLFADFDVNELNSPVIRLIDFQKIPGPKLAQQLFSVTIPPRSAQYQAIKNLGYNPIQWNRNYGVWMINLNGRSVPATEPQGPLNPTEVTRAMQQVIVNAYVGKYREFLNNLSRKIHDVMQEWAEDAPEALITRLQDYYKYWQLAIQKQLRDLQR